jgi:hypothetical protein
MTSQELGDDDSRGYEEVLCESPSGSSYDDDKMQKRPYG